MKLFGSLRWDGGARFFYRFGGGGVDHCTRASLHSDTVEDLIRNSVEGSSLQDVDARESVAAGLAKAEDTEIQDYKLQELAIRRACDCNGG